MTVPGQIPDSELADTPRNIRRIGVSQRPDIPRDAFNRFDDSSDDRWERILDSLTTIFDPQSDRIVLERPAHSNGSSEWTAAARGDRPGLHLAASIPVLEGEGLSLALGLAVARQCFEQRHWIVVVASAEKLLREMSHATIEQLQGIETGLLVIAVDDGNRYSPPPGEELRWKGQFDALDSRWLSEIGLEFSGPIDREDAASLRARMQEIRLGNRSHLLLVRSAPSFQSDLPTESRSRGILRLRERSPASSEGDALAVLGDELRRLRERDPGLIALACSALAAHWERSVPRRDRRELVSDAGESIVARAQGAVLGGCRPVMLFDEDSLPRHLTGIRREICDPVRPATILLLENAAAKSADRVSRTAKGPSPLAYLRLLPKTDILVPADRQELRDMLHWSQSADGPVAIYIPRDLPTGSREDAAPAPIESGRARLLSDGVDVALVALGPHLQAACDAARDLSRQGLSVAVVNARFAHPIDVPLLERLADRVRGFVTVEPDGSHGGFGTAILERLSARGVTVPVIATRSSAAERNGVSEPRKAIAGRVVESALDLMNRGSAPRSDARRGRIPADKRRRTEIERKLLLTPDRLQAEREAVKGIELSPAIQAWHDLYSQTGHRSNYLWRWCLHGVRITALPSVPPELFEHVCDTKLASIILCVLFDDVADEHGRERLLTEMLRVTRDDQPANFEGLDDAERRQVAVTELIWRDYQARTRSYPHAEVYADLLRYDLMQFFNTMCYSQLLNNRPSLLNLTEHDLYTSHNMQMISFSTIDLMCTEGFCVNELGKLREAMWHAQCMGRIGNLLSTWQREIGSRDFTSGVFARAVSRGDLTLDQLTAGDANVVESAILNGAHDQYFLRRWLQHRDHLRFRAGQIRSIDLRPVLTGHDRFLLMHLGCRGLI